MPILILLISALAAPLQAQQIDTLALRAHTRFLSDDALAGRGTGTEGERMAALYIESQAIRIGLRPGGTNNSFRQPIPLREAMIRSARLQLRSARDSLAFDERDFTLNTGGESGLKSFGGRALFAGAVEHARTVSDSLLRGRVLVIVSTLGLDAQTLIPRWIRAGVAGVIVLVNDSAQFQLFARSRGESRYYVAGAVEDPIWQPQLPVVLAGPRVTRVLVREIGSVLGQLNRGGAFTPVPLEHTVQVDVQTDTRTVPAANVIAVLRGSDPALRDEYVLYTAHYDHLGVSLPDARGDSIYNGFSDNAAGVAMLLSIAQAMSARSPARSVAFVFFTGEERGLLGSTWFTASPTIPLERIAAVINLDAGAPPARPIEWRLAGGTANTIGALAREIGTARKWRIDLSDASPNSDYWPFHARRIPSVFLIPGAQWEGLGTAQRDALRARWDRYHRADDEWAADFPFSGLERYAELALEIGRRVADTPGRPRMLTQ